MKKFVKFLLSLCALMMFMGVAIAAGTDSENDSALSVLGGEQTQQSVVVDTSPKMNEIKDEKISALTGLGDVIKTAINSGLCDVPQSLAEASECVMKVASQDDVLSFDQAYLLREVTMEKADFDYMRAFILLNPDVFNDYANEQDREFVENYRSLEYNDANQRKLLDALDNNEPNLSDANYFYYRDKKEYKRGNGSVSELYAAEWNNLLDDSLRDNFVSGKAAAIYGLANGDDDALALLAVGSYKEFYTHASQEEMKAATRGLLAGDFSESSLLEKHQALLEDIQSGRQDAPMQKNIVSRFVNGEIRNSTLKNVGTVVGCVAGGIPMGIGMMVGVGLSIPGAMIAGSTGVDVAAGIGLVASGGAAIAEGAYVLKGVSSVGEAVLETAMANPAIVVPAAGAAAIWHGVEQYNEWSVNPSKYSEREANIINRELEKPIEEQDVMD